MGIFGSIFHRKKGLENEALPDLAMEPGPENGPWSNTETNESDDFNPQRIQSTRADEMARYEAHEYNQAPRDLVSGERFRGGGISEKDVQLILSKLDLINSRLDNLNRRFEALENSKRKDIW